MTNGKLSQFDCTLLAKHRRAVLQQIVSQLASCPDLFSCHQVLITLILAVLRVMGDGDVHLDVVCPMKCSDLRVSCAS